MVVVIWFDSSNRDTTKPWAVQGYWVNSTITHCSQCSHLELYSSKVFYIKENIVISMKIPNIFVAKLLAYPEGLHVTDNKQTPSVYTGGVWTTSRKVSIWICWSKGNRVIDGQWHHQEQNIFFLYLWWNFQSMLVPFIIYPASRRWSGTQVMPSHYLKQVHLWTIKMI